MKRIVTILLSAFLVFILPSAVSYGAIGTGVKKGHHRSTVFVYNMKKNFFCGGTVIPGDMVITAAHCFAKGSGFDFSDDSIEMVDAKDLYAVGVKDDNSIDFYNHVQVSKIVVDGVNDFPLNKRVDVVVLKLSKSMSGVEAAGVASDAPPDGEIVYSDGLYSRGKDDFYATSSQEYRIDTFSYQEDSSKGLGNPGPSFGRPVMTLSSPHARIMGGDSGFGIFNKEGLLVGINTTGDFAHKYSAKAVPTSSIGDILVKVGANPAKVGKVFFKEKPVGKPIRIIQYGEMKDETVKDVRVVGWECFYPDFKTKTTCPNISKYLKAKTSFEADLYDNLKYAVQVEGGFTVASAPIGECTYDSCPKATSLNYLPSQNPFPRTKTTQVNVFEPGTISVEEKNDSDTFVRKTFKEIKDENVWKTNVFYGVCAVGALLIIVGICYISSRRKNKSVSSLKGDSSIEKSKTVGGGTKP